MIRNDEIRRITLGLQRFSLEQRWVFIEKLANIGYMHKVIEYVEKNGEKFWSEHEELHEMDKQEIDGAFEFYMGYISERVAIADKFMEEAFQDAMINLIDDGNGEKEVLFL